MKHIVCGGCSFTRQQKRIGINGTSDDFMDDSKNMWRWPHHIQSIYDCKVHNLGNPTNDNQVISFSIIDKVNELIDSGVSSDDIFVITQWSDAQRRSFFISDSVSKMCNSELKYNDNNENAYAHVSAYLDNSDKNIGKNGYFIQSGGYSYNHVLYDVVDIFDKIAEYSSDEYFLIGHFKNILFLQNYLKLKGIDFIQFNLSFNFQFCGEDLNYKSIYYDKKIPKCNFDFKYHNPYVQSLYKMIDMNKMWLYKDEFTNCGGITEWAIRNYKYEEDTQLFMEHDLEYTFNSIEEFISSRNIDENPYGHPSEQMNKKFVKMVLNSFIEKFLK